MTDKTKTDDANLPAQIDIGRTMSLALRLWLEPAFFNHATRMATQLSRATGFTPKHLLGNIEACFAVVEKALVWGLSPSAVAQCTYTTPSGSIGYEGKLCHAILEASGQFEGGIRFEHYGTVIVKHENGLEEDFRSNDPKLKEVLAEAGATIKEQHQWKKLAGKNEVKTSKNGNPFIVPTWGQRDAFGLGVTVIGQIKGEAEPRRFNFDLVQAWPRNSTLWATAPDRQIMYTAVRAFGNHVVPALLLGMPSADEYEGPAVGFDNAKEINPADRPAKPKPTKSDVTEAGDYVIMDDGGVERLFVNPMEAHDALVTLLKAADTRDIMDGIWESNGMLITQLREGDLGAAADSLHAVLDEQLAMFDQAARDRVAEQKRAQVVARQRAADEAVAAAQRERDEAVALAQREKAAAKKKATEKKPEPEAQKEPDPAPEVDAAVAAAEAAADAAAEEAAYAAADVQDDGREFEEQQHDEPVEEDTTIQRDDDALPPEPAKPKAALPPRKHEDFWQRADYGMTPEKNPKGQPDWMKWNGWMQLAIKDARNIDELTKLDIDNLNWLKQMEGAGAGYTKGAHNLRDQISARSRQLTDEEV